MSIRYLSKEFGANSTTAIANDATGTTKVLDQPNAAGFVADAVDFNIKYNRNGTIVTLVDASSVQTLSNKTVTALLNTYAVDAPITVSSQVAYLTKGSAAAMTLAAPGAAGIGARITIITGSDFAHVVTFTGSTLRNGTTGAKITWTATAFQGSSITVVGVTAALWDVESQNLGVVA